ncbi:hypothetical protein KKF82_08315 [Patescibacteria group bacterium]|nr:hypothetical protein [Patescibacteria group bacterium]
MYNIALEDLLNIFSAWNGDVGKYWYSSYKAMLSAAEEIQGAEFFVNSLAQAEPYYIEQNICDLLMHTQESLPLVTLRKELVPSQAGWVTLAKPFPLLPSIREIKTPPALKGFSWTIEKVESTDGIYFVFYEKMEQLYLEPISIFACPFGENFMGVQPILRPDEKVEESVVMGRMHQLERYALTFFSLINQKLLATSRRHANRAFRRRIQREQQIAEPLINVVILRHKHFFPTGEEREVEWSCRWIVRGHWREQWYPSQQVHQPIWIFPYIKGPEDRELKQPGIKVFDVAR